MEYYRTQKKEFDLRMQLAEKSYKSTNFFLNSPSFPMKKTLGTFDIRYVK